MKSLITYRVNTIFAVSIMALATFAAADLIISVSTDAEIEYKLMAHEQRLMLLEERIQMARQVQVTE